jgi:hypothetical protein
MITVAMFGQSAATDVYGSISLALNVVQTCFLAWLAVYARSGR